MRQLRALIVLVMTVLLVGCVSTMQDVVQEHAEGGGTSATYPVSLERAWEISKAVFRWEGCHAIEEHRDTGHMLTSNGSNPGPFVRALYGSGVPGAVMGAWLTAVDEDTTVVTVVTKRRDSLSFVTGLTEGTFHERFREAVARGASGGPLPEDSP